MPEKPYTVHTAVPEFTVLSCEEIINPEALRYIRSVNDHTQKELADQLGVALYTVQRWESGISQPKPHHLLAIRRMYVDTVKLSKRAQR